MMQTKKARFSKYPAYKDSGVEWLGEVPSNWEVLPLFALTKLKSISNFPNLELLSVYLDLGVIRFSDIDAKRTNATSLDLSKYQKVEPGDFVLNNQQAWRGSVGVSNYEGIVSPAYIILSLSEKLNPSFSNYYFRNGAMVSQYLISSKGVGTIQRNLYWPQLRRTYVGIPPKEEQTAIAKFLDEKTAKIDQAIAQKEQLIALLKERKQIIIQNVVTGKVVWSKNKQKMIPLAQSEVEGKDSSVEWIGEIPEHWEVVKFKFLIKTKARLGWKGLKADEYVEHSPYGFLSTPNIKNDEISFEDANHITEFRYEESPEIMLEEGDVLLVKDGSTLGISNIVTKLPFKCTVNSSIAVLRIMNKKRLLPSYLNLFLKSETCQSLIEKKKDGMGVPHLFQRDINNFSVPVFNVNEQVNIVQFIKAKSIKIDEAISLQQTQIKKIKEYKATLIDSAVKGKIKVPGN